MQSDAGLNKKLLVLVQGYFPIDGVCLEITQKCNVRCIFCYKLNESGRHPDNDWAYDKLLSIKDSLQEFKKILFTGDEGEALLNHDLVRITQWLRKSGIETEIFTNGSALTPTNVSNLFQSVDSFHVSLHAATAELYEKIVLGANFGKVISNLMFLKENKPVTTYFEIGMVGMKSNIHQFPDVVRLAKEAGAICISLQILMERGTSEVEGQSLVLYPKLLQDYWLKAALVAKEVGIRIGTTEPYDSIANGNNSLISKPVSGAPGFHNSKDVDWPTDKLLTRKCLRAFTLPRISYSGDVTPCCSPTLNIMGNVFKQPFRQIWQNKEYVALRRGLLTGNPIEMCRQCRNQPVCSLEEFHELVNKHFINITAEGHLSSNRGLKNTTNKKPRFLIIIPAYNEEATIKEVVTKAKKYADVCVINDNSKDSTPDILKQIKDIHVINHEKNTHIPGALLDGFKYAIKNNYDYAIAIDAGLSHNPDELPLFINHKEADLVIGCRKQKNNTPLHRKLLSLVGNFIYNISLDFPRSLLKKRYYQDISSGYRRYSKKAIKLLLSKNIESESFEIMIETAMYIYKNKLLLSEVPITYNFSNSSLNSKVVKDALKMCAKIILKPKK